MEKKLDKLDISILRQLQEDSSRPYKQMAGNLNTSSTTICDRIRKLEKRGFIIAYVAVLERRKLKQDVLAYIYLNLSRCSAEVINAFRDAVSEIREVCECCTVTGRYNIRLKITTTDSNMLSSIERKIAGIKNVMTIETYVVLDNIIADSGFNFQ